MFAKSKELTESDILLLRDYFYCRTANRNHLADNVYNVPEGLRVPKLRAPKVMKCTGKRGRC